MNIDQSSFATDWTDHELEAAVRAYLRMTELESLSKPYSKRHIYRELARQYGRADKAFEYRMRNISAVLDELGESWVPGLKPASNVGPKLSARIVQLLDRLRNPKPKRNLIAAGYKEKLPAMRDWLINIAREGGKVNYSDVMNVFGIDRFSLRHAMDYLGHQADNLDEPILTALIVGKKSGRCSSGLASEFNIEDDELERKNLYEHWGSSKVALGTQDSPASIEVRAARFVSVEARPEQAWFRRRVFLNCHGRCVISGCEIRQALDAAHKHGHDWRQGSNSGDDGFLLRKDLHGLYDSGLLLITEEGRVKLLSTAAIYYSQFDDVKISFGLGAD